MNRRGKNEIGQNELQQGGAKIYPYKGSMGGGPIFMIGRRSLSSYLGRRASPLARAAS